MILESLNNGFPGENASIYTIMIKKISCVKKIIDDYKKEIKKILIAGCGDGKEAKVLSELFPKSEIIAIDISIEDSIDGNIIFKRGDLHSLEFDNNSFDLIYCYHVLEHVSKPDLVLSEISRVLNHKGILFIGFPNRNRIIGYIGSHVKINKLKANIADYKMRIKGKFRNDLGAHAGFSNKEFLTIASSHFTQIFSVRNRYFLENYSKYDKIVMIFISIKLDDIIFPSNYYVCMK